MFAEYSVLASEPLGRGLLPWAEVTRLTGTPGSPFGSEEDSGLSTLLISKSALLVAALQSGACLRRGSRGTSGAQFEDLVLCKGTGLAETSPSIAESLLWPSVTQR